MIRPRPIQGEGYVDFLGESEGSFPQPHDSLPVAGEAMNDFWSMSVQERIAEERESSNAQIRTMLDEQRRKIIDEYGEKVLHHELLAAQAEQDRKILQEELLRTTTGCS